MYVPAISGVEGGEWSALHPANPAEKIIRISFIAEFTFIKQRMLTGLFP
jgi:hypothetical protein